MRYSTGPFGFAVTLGAFVLTAVPVMADEVKTPVSASMMLNILSAPSAVHGCWRMAVFATAR
jgi:hypothetical protein